MFLDMLWHHDASDGMFSDTFSGFIEEHVTLRRDGAPSLSGDASERSVSFQVLLLIDVQLSYINTNHEDFIGFAK